MELEWWKMLGQQTRQNPIIAAQAVTTPTPAAPTTTSFDIPFADIGTIGGGAIGFTSYVWTYPIVWIDGPLPIVDALWLGGLAYSTGRAAATGRRVGRRLDTIEEALL
jgi:hypothetical protein